MQDVGPCEELQQAAFKSDPRTSKTKQNGKILTGELKVIPNKTSIHKLTFTGEGGKEQFLCKYKSR